MKTLKVRIYPNGPQRALFHKCFYASRYFYNLAVREINRRYEARKSEFEQSLTCVCNCTRPKVEGAWTCETHKNKALPWNLQVTLPSIRKAVMVNDKQLDESSMWQKDVPYDTRQLALKEAITAYKAAITNKVRGNIQTFTLKERSESYKEGFWVDSGAIKRKPKGFTIFSQRLKKDARVRMRGRAQKRLPTELSHDCQVYREGDAYYLLLPVSKVRVAKEPPYEVAALDPGVRTFQTGYSPEGIIFKVGEARLERVKKLHEKIDQLKAVRSSLLKRRTKQNIAQRIRKLFQKATYSIQDLHNQTAHWLVENFNSILITPFETHDMVQGGLSRKTNRCMMQLAFYKFQLKLKGLCETYGRKLYIVGEEYTTKTCGVCGHLHGSIGGAKVFKCPECDYEMDRDTHGARNIFLRTLTVFK